MRTISGSRSSDSPPPTSNDRQLQLITTSAAASAVPFELPDDWIVEVRPRGNCNTCSHDKYYYEPGTGRKFRSLLSVRRYLYGEDSPPRKRQSPGQNALVPYQNSVTVRRIVYGGKLLSSVELEEARDGELDDLDYDPSTLNHRLSSTIPDGWIVEEVPRRNTFKSDRYYIEPGTGKRFRSVPEVERYLAVKQHSFKCKALTWRNPVTAPRTPVPPRKNRYSITTVKDAIIDLANPPEKVNWVLSGDSTKHWSPLIEECVLPDYVKEQWSETFLLGMNGRKHRVPQLTMNNNNGTRRA